MHHPGCNHLEPGSLKPGIDLANHIFSNRIGLDDGESSFDSHVNSFALKEICPDGKTAHFTPPKATKAAECLSACSAPTTTAATRCAATATVVVAASTTTTTTFAALALVLPLTGETVGADVTKRSFHRVGLARSCRAITVLAALWAGLSSTHARAGGGLNRIRYAHRVGPWAGIGLARTATSA